MQTIAHGTTDTGLCRESNEDTYVIDDTLALYAVADGMGGHAAGEVASALAVDAAHRTVVRLTRVGVQDPVHLARAATRAAIEAVWSARASEPAFDGMGTTLTLLVIRGTEAAMAHVGDSRLYRLREGEVERLSQDHTWIEELIRSGHITRQQAMRGPLGHILQRSIGKDREVEIDVREITVRVGDRFLLCTDGLCDYLDTDDQILHELQADLITAPQLLVDYANACGGDDNVTAVVVDVLAEDQGLFVASEACVA